MILDTLSNAEYHDMPEVSNSGLKLIGQSPAHFKAGFSGINPDNARVGTAVHSYILENGKGVIRITENGPNRSSKDDRRWWQKYFLSQFGAHIDTSKRVETWYPEIERQTGSVIVTADEYEQISQMIASFKANEQAVELLKDTRPELSVFNEVNGVHCKSRPDASRIERIVDIKSCADASEQGFGRACARFGYHRQDAFYSVMHRNEHGIWPEFWFIAIEKSPPYSCVCYQLDEEAKENGYLLIERDLETYRQCLESGVWPGYENNSSLSIPIYDSLEVVDNYEELMV